MSRSRTIARTGIAFVIMDLSRSESAATWLQCRAGMLAA
jgi:hypothetical protein